MFHTIASAIATKIAPTTVFDAGCAMGILIEQLRNFGIDAEGVDISEYAIHQAHESVRPFVRVGSVSEPLQRRYDLIICIEVLEHMERAEAEQAVAVFCAHTNDIIFSSSPNDYKEATHFNVQPAEYWAELFASHQFFRDVAFDASFVTPWAVRFRKRSEPLPRIVRDYEQRFSEVWKANTDLRTLVIEQRNSIAEQRNIIADQRNIIADQHNRIADQHAQIVHLQAGIEALNISHNQLNSEFQQAVHELKAYISTLETDLARKIAHGQGLAETIKQLQAGRVLRLMHRLERWRTRLGFGKGQD